MSKIPGLGELHEGVLEQDPLDDTFQIRTPDEVVRLQDVFAQYVGRGVRFTIGFMDALDDAASRATGDGAVVTLGDMSKDS